MNIRVNNRLVMFLLVGLSTYFYCIATEQVTRARRDAVTLSQRDAHIVEKALETLVERAPRLDAPDVNDPDFPIGGMELDEIRRILCSIKEQNKKICDKVEDLQADVSALDVMMDFDHELICSKLDVIDEEVEMHDETICSKLEPIGNFTDEAWDFGDCVDKQCIDDSRGTIIQWLKTIFWVITGANPPGTCNPQEDPCLPMQLPQPPPED